MHVMSLSILSIFYQFVREVCMCTSFTLKIVHVLIKREIQIPANIFFFVTFLRCLTRVVSYFYVSPDVIEK